MIQSLHVERFKCFKNFLVDLDPLTVVIGPNDSGKTAFLQALLLWASLGPDQAKNTAELEAQLGFSFGSGTFWREDKSSQIKLTARLNEKDVLVESLFSGQTLLFRKPLQSSGEAGTKLGGPGMIPQVGYYRFVPAAMRKPTPLSHNMFRMTGTGEGLATFLDDILRADRDAFMALEKDFYARFPEYKRLIIGTSKIENVNAAGHVLRFVTKHGEELAADAVSDGAILCLGFLALYYQTSRTDLLLIEEPENGVHHSRLKDIVGILRSVQEQKGLQVILTTHSPYLLDLVEPEHVRVFAKDKEGAVHARKLSDYPEVDRLKKHFMSGEIWTGLSEEEIVLSGEKGGE